MLSHTNVVSHRVKLITIAKIEKKMVLAQY